MPTTYAVASAKGGVGKTTTAANLAATLAAAGFETVAVDGDIGTANLAPALGFEVPEGGATLHDVLAGEAEPVDATYRGPHGLAVVPGDESLSAFRSADPSRIREVIGSITNADYVVVDTGAGLTHESALPLSLADGVLLVSTPTRDALTDTGKTVELAERLGGTVAGLALTRVGPDDSLESALEAANVDPEAFDVPVTARVPEDPVVAEALAASEPLSEYAPGSDPAAAYRSLASSLTGEPIRPPLSYEVEEGEREPSTPDGERAGAVEDDGTEGGDPATAGDADDADSSGAESVEDGERPGADDEAGIDVAEGEAEADVAEGEAEADVTEGEAEADVAEDDDPSVSDEVPEADEGDVEDVVVEAEPADVESSVTDADGADEVDEADSTSDSRDADGANDADDVDDADDAKDAGDADDAVIIEDEGDDLEDGAAADARRAVLDEDERQAVDGAAGSDDPGEIEDDAIPFADGTERKAESGDGSDEGSEEDDGGKDGGFLSRLFR
ncbi:MinD/ParA family ATP-binding protein [Halorarum salinum]|uniref:P-loop NTPase n=1 Tax=Halorarum salinum TaxID=2743089 RepID=A0A7D5QDT4_9EURY|nr:P-loop NTPase [Halobaculum salinum]QLG63520.1 P-loop NTPase [Halobaculum salinum]